MAEFEYIAPGSRSGLLRLATVAEIANELLDGGLAVLPTETGYMLAALATSEEAILRAFAVKQRDLKHTMHVACSSLDMVRDVADTDARVRRLIGELTPGPITVVTRQTSRLPDRLVTVNGTVGIRVPDNPATLQVISAVGAPLTATSLNRAGEPPTSIDRQELELLGWPSRRTVYVVEDEGSIGYDRPSTVVRVAGSDLEILREGPVSEEVVRDVWKACA